MIVPSQYRFWQHREVSTAPADLVGAVKFLNYANDMLFSLSYSQFQIAILNAL